MQLSQSKLICVWCTYYYNILYIILFINTKQNYITLDLVHMFCPQMHMFYKVYEIYLYFVILAVFNLMSPGH